MAKTIRDLYLELWQFRAGVEQHWKTPDSGHSMMFAFTEAMESLHEHIALEDYKRFQAKVTQAVVKGATELEALQQAMCAVSTSLDAWLRLDDSFSRNRSLTPDPNRLLDELADTAIMLLTALGPTPPTSFKVTGLKPNIDLQDIVFMVCDTWAAYRVKRRNPERWRIICLGTIQAINQYPGMNLYKRVIERLERIRLKHVPDMPTMHNEHSTGDDIQPEAVDQTVFTEVIEPVLEQ